MGFSLPRFGLDRRRGTGSIVGPVSSPTFDAADKERTLRAEADAWDTTAPVDAEPGDIPIVDVSDWFRSGDERALRSAAAELSVACRTVGFHQLVGHDIGPDEATAAFDWSHRFDRLRPAVKERILMDRPGHPVGGVGYLPVGERKLPRRAQGNLNEAFLVKGGGGLGFDDGQWPDDTDLPGFRAAITSWASRLKGLAVRLLPLYAVALDLPADYFAPAFTDPFWRLRLTHYPPAKADLTGPGGSGSVDPDAGDPGVPNDERAFGIAPHVDTTFFTLLLQGGPGLVIHHRARDRWIRVPVVDGAFVVNSGELLRQWSNDHFLSTRHVADNRTDTSRHSIPFFFNANPDHLMTCLPTCHGPNDPPRYPPVSYRESQAAVQGE